MIDVYVLSLILVIIYYVVMPLVVNPLIGVVQKRKNLSAPPITEKIRVDSYIKIIAWGWGSTLAVFILCFLAGISFNDIGLRGISLSKNIWITSITLIVYGVMLIANIYCIIAYLVSPEYREEQKEEFAKSTMNEATKSLVPRSKKEKRYHLFVSLTAGIGEEIDFRGFLIFLLRAVFPNTSMLLVLLVASVIFGIGHTYQGFVKGIIRTTMWGFLFCSLFLVTDSIIPGMLLHFIGNFESAFQLSENTE